MLKTFQEAKESNILQISGCTPNSPRFKGLLNEATEALLNRGDFEGTVVPIQVCVKSGCVVFPRYVQVLREAKTCWGPTYLKNEYYDFVGRECYYGLSESRCDGSMVQYGRVPTYNTIMGTGRTVRAYAQSNADYSKKVTIFGIDNNGQPLMHRDDNGAWREGWILYLKNPYAETTGYISNIHRVLKDRTEKPVTLFAYNGDSDVLEDLAVYDPGETNPSFARYKLNLPACVASDGSESRRSLIALVKLAFVPVEFDTDLVLINNLRALKYVMQSILSGEGKDHAGEAVEVGLGIAELNHQLRNNNFGQTTTINANAVGHTIYSPI